MNFLDRIKGNAKGVFKEHICSIAVFLIGMVLMGINEDFWDVFHSSKGALHQYSDLFYTAALFFVLMTFGFVLCESNYLYKKSIGKISSLKEIKKSFVYIIVILLSTGIFGFFSYMTYYLSGVRYNEIRPYLDYFTRFFGVILVVCAVSALFFMYKKSGLSFEGFMCKSFTGLVKAGVIFGVVEVGYLIIVWIFESLFFDITINILITCIITALVGYPAALAGVTRFEEGISRFARALLGYVFTALAAIGYIIVYAYIMKIIVTWTFPSNQVFAICTFLFFAGAFVWTMAQSFAEGKLLTLVRIFPFFFIPFIIIQSMCLYMRVSAYGLTTDRYFGIMLIVFEFFYELYYLVRFLMKKGLGGILFPVLIAVSVIALVIPGINAFAAVTNSQKRVVAKFVDEIEAGSLPSAELAKRAYSSYKEIKRNGGLEGENYLSKLHKTYSDQELKDLFDKYGEKESNKDNEKPYEHIARHSWNTIELKGYKYMTRVNYIEATPEDIDFSAIPLGVDSEKDHKEIVVDLSGVIKELIELGYAGADFNEQYELINEPIVFPDGVFYIDYLRADTKGDNKEEAQYLAVYGYFLHN